MTEKQLIASYGDDLKRLVQDEVIGSVDPEKTYLYAQLRRNDLYYRGHQYISLFYTGGFADFAPVSGTTDSQLRTRTSDQVQAFDYVVNTYRGDLRKFVAVLGQRSPNVKALPSVKDNESHIRRARQADLVAGLLRSLWDVDYINRRLYFLLAKNGPTFSYVAYQTNPDRYGWIKEPVYKENFVEVMPPSFDCPACGLSGDLPEDGLCPECLGELGPNDVAEAVSLYTMEETDTKKYPAGGVEVTLCSGLEVTTPWYIHTLDEAPWLLYEHEIDKGDALSLYPDLRDKMGNIDSYYGGLSQGTSSGRHAREQLSSPTGAASYYRKNRWLLTRAWLRPSMFQLIPDTEEELRKTLIEKYPDGLKMTLVNGEIVEGGLEHERLDDHWTACAPEESEYLWTADPYMQDMIQAQDLINDYMNITIETAERQNPFTVFDPAILDPDVVNQLGRKVARFIPSKPNPGQRFKDSFHRVSPADFDPNMLKLVSDITERYREITGILPPIFGGGAPGGRRTAREVEIQRNQALMQLNTVWNNGRKFMALTQEKGIREVARYQNGGSFRFPLSNGGEEMQLGDLSELLQGGWYLEAEESMPMTAGQRRDYTMGLLNQTPPEVQAALGTLHPANLPKLHETIGLPDMIVPGLNARDMLMQMIHELSESEPVQQPDPFTGEVVQSPSVQPDTFLFAPQLAVDVIREWLTGEEGRKLRDENPSGYLNVLLYGKAYQQAMEPPPMPGEGEAPPPPPGAPMMEGPTVPEGAMPPGEPGLETPPPPGSVAQLPEEVLPGAMVQ